MEARFLKYAELIINLIEGGYYNPARHNTNGMGSSGETMMGIDRVNGGSLKDTAEGKEFWSLIDANSANWAHGYKGGPLEPKLRELAAKMMYNQYEKLSNLYLTAESRKKIARSPKLETHFYYACWNGSGRFQNFAKEFNTKVSQGASIKQLEDFALNSRLTHSVALIRKGGEILRDKLWPKLDKGGGWFWWLLAAGVGIYFLTKKS